MAGKSKYHDKLPEQHSREAERENYVPDHLDMARFKRTSLDIYGHYHHCRHYQKHESLPDNVQVDCRKHGLKENCKSCYTCPNCGGNLFYDRTITTDFTQEFIDHAKRCVQCGEYFHGEQEAVAHRPEVLVQDKSNVPFCAVQGCTHRTWDHKRYENLPICNSHHRQVKTWQRAKKKGEKTDAERPLVLDNGRLIVNPFCSKPKRKEKDKSLCDEPGCTHIAQTKGKCGKCYIKAKREGRI